MSERNCCKWWLGMGMERGETEHRAMAKAFLALPPKGGGEWEFGVAVAACLGRVVGERGSPAAGRRRDKHAGYLIAAAVGVRGGAAGARGERHRRQPVRNQRGR